MSPAATPRRRSPSSSEQPDGDNAGDNRSHKVSFEKINRVLPGFSCDWSAAAGARQLFELLTRIDLGADTSSRGRSPA